LSDLDSTIGLLDRINAAVSKYDPAIKEKARDLLIAAAFPGHQAVPPRTVSRSDAGGQKSGEGAPDRLVGLLDKWTPDTGSERALLGAYAIANGAPGVPVSRLSVNRLISNHGQGVKNITRAIQANIDAKPQLMRQVRKTGRTRQARKQYTLTQPGVKWVEDRTRTGK
jgi:hypothetical protein